MIMNQAMSPQEGDGVRSINRRIHRVLEKREAMNLSEISRALVLDAREVEERLHSLVGTGEVERLRPVAYPGEEHDFFRLRHLNDRAFLWEQDYLEVGPQAGTGAYDFIREVRRLMDRKVLQFG